MYPIKFEINGGPTRVIWTELSSSQPTHSFFKIIDDVKSPISNILVLEIGDKIIETLKWS